MGTPPRFDVPYSRITVADVIKKVDVFLQEAFAFLEHKPRARFLRYIHDQYADVQTGASLPNAPFLFPQPEAIIPHRVHIPPPGPHHIDVSDLNLRFIAKFVPSKSPNRCLYDSVMVHEDHDRPPAPVYIKFVPHYGGRPHRLLAKHGLAPKLHYCAEVVYGLMKVVMDDLRGSNPRPESYIDPINKHIFQAVTLLHENNLVHGDLCMQNVVIDKTNQAFLIDFDLSGVAGVAKYLNRLNPEITWPRLIVEMEGRLVDKNDDCFMLQHLLNPPPRKSVMPRETSPKRPRDEDEAYEGGEEGRLSKKHVLLLP